MPKPDGITISSGPMKAEAISLQRRFA